MQSSLPWVQGRSVLSGSRGSALWRVKGGSPYRVKGETPWQVEGGSPAQGKLMLCVNLYWVLSDAKTGRFGSKAALPTEKNWKERRTE